MPSAYILLVSAGLILFVGNAYAQGTIGVDVAGANITSSSATSALACAQNCDGNSQCVAWSWNSCQSVCVLKKTVTSRVNNKCVVSDLKLGQSGYDHSGYDLSTVGASCPSSCAYSCSRTKLCVAWSYVPAYGSCYLKYWASPATVASGVVSGVQGTLGQNFGNVGTLSTSTLAVNATANDCSALCEKTTSCVAWSFGLAGTSCSATARKCQLKTFTPGQRTNNVCSASGLGTKFYVTGGGPAVSVVNTSHTGNQTDKHNSNPETRDGGAVGFLDNKIVWFWSDTSKLNSAGALIGFYDNTGAIGDPSNPTNVTGPQRIAIPYTANENLFNSQNPSNNPRAVLWPKSGVVEVSSGVGLLWVPRGYYGNNTVGAYQGTEDPGIVLSSVSIGSDGYPNVTRLSDAPFFSSPVPLFGNVAATKDNNFVYLYSSSQIGSSKQYNHPTYIARAPILQASSISAYQYYNSSTSTWTSQAPSDDSNVGEIFKTGTGLDANVYYSSYHKAWIMMLQYGGAVNVTMKTAPAPEGPWTSGVSIYQAPKPTNPNVGYIYGTTGTNLYDLTGKTASVDFTWCTPNSYVNWVEQITFA